MAEIPFFTFLAVYREIYNQRRSCFQINKFSGKFDTVQPYHFFFIKHKILLKFLFDL